ncbi:MAG TPA: CDP-alcohol phosphatidyltransferase family protein [Anaerolineales bacterium]|jgi:phosphatidylcholine synthase
MTTARPLPLNRRIYALGVHLFTATGAIWGFLAILAIFKQEWKLAILWMVLAILVDSFDGMLARLADVRTYASEIDGALLDNIVDYFNYVVVPAVFLVQGDFVPAAFRLGIAILILLTSAYQFTQVDAKTDETRDYFFKGFPDYWNVVILYMLVMRLDPWVNLGFLVLFNILVFVPIKYLYPSRDSRLKTFTLMFSILYAIVGVYGLAHYPDVPRWVVWSSFLYVGYYMVMSLWPRKKPQPAN